MTEEPGVGLGAHLAGVPHSDPGRADWDQPPALRLRVDGASVPLWPVPRTVVEGDEDRTVLAGEAQGRWLWVVVRPAEAVLGLVDRASLGDASGLGPELVGGPWGPPPAGGAARPGCPGGIPRGPGPARWARARAITWGDR